MIDTLALAWRHLKFSTKAELLQKGIFFPHPFICQRRFSNEKVEIENTKPTFIILVLKVEY